MIILFNHDHFYFVSISDVPEVKEAAIDALHQKHRENRLHHFTEKDREKHLSNWE